MQNIRTRGRDIPFVALGKYLKEKLGSWNISNRVPSWRQVAPVYAVIVFMIFSWTLLRFFWDVPSWFLYLQTGEILIVFAYAAVTNFAESMAVLCVPVVLGLLLPKKWFSDVFVARGAALAAASLGYLMWLAYQFQSMDDYLSLSLKVWSLVLAAGVILLLVFLAGRVGVVRKAIELLADRMTIFLYIFIPLSIISFLAILIRWAVV